MTSLVWTAAPSPSRGWQSTHSLSLSPARPSFLFCFLSFFQFSVFTDEYPGQIEDDLLESQSLLVSYRQVANTKLAFFFLLHCAVKSHNRDFLPWVLEDEKRSHAWLLCWYNRTQVLYCLLIYREHSSGISVFCLSLLLHHTRATVHPAVETRSWSVVVNQSFELHCYLVLVVVSV